MRPIRAFLGLDPNPIEVSRLPGGYIGLFADLSLIPTTSIQNVVIQDLSLDNNFTAGQYPGMGNRNIADDGHEVTVQLSVTPAP
jgi:hypothetical protein